MEADQPKHCAFMGASVMDLISYVDRFPVPGETLSGNEFRKGTGGKAANACVMAARLGLSTRIMAKIGHDTFGEEMMKNFQQQNVCTDYLFITKDAFTSTASITVTRKGENNIVYVPGATNLLTPEEITAAAEKGLFKDCRLFVSTFECTPPSLHTALQLARKHGVPTLVNGAPPFPKPMENSHIYPLCDILCVNETEAHLMTKLRVDSIDDCRIACKMILDKGCRSVILTMGANGAMFVNRNQALHIPVPQKIEPVDTTGAGDSFMGALAFFIVHYNHLPIEEQIKRCNLIASYTVLRPGTQESYPYKSELPSEIFM